jgi:chorismate--pyruvate lyase
MALSFAHTESAILPTFGTLILQAQSQLFQRPPVWRDALRAKPPKALRSWLFETGSLTARLRAGVGGKFRVRLLAQAWRKPFYNEARALDLPAQHVALAREVVLLDAERPLVLARTLLPPRTLRGPHVGLAHLGNRPLGELLFANPKLLRTHLELAEIAPQDWQAKVASAYGLDEPVWGRRSRYALEGLSLLVCEFFLPSVLTLSESGD